MSTFYEAWEKSNSKAAAPSLGEEIDWRAAFREGWEACVEGPLAEAEAKLAEAVRLLRESQDRSMQTYTLGRHESDVKTFLAQFKEKEKA